MDCCLNIQLYIAFNDCSFLHESYSFDIYVLYDKNLIKEGPRSHSYRMCLV